MDLLQLDDQNVVRLVLQGRREEFRHLVQKYQAPVYRVVCRFIPDRHECEDLAQDVFLAALSRLSTFDSERGVFSTWLFTIARNKCINRLQKRQVSLLGDQQNEIGEGDEDANEVVYRELQQRLDKALSRLPLMQRTAFVLAELEGLSYDEVARIEMVKLGTVKSRINRARSRLKLLLSDGLESP